MSATPKALVLRAPGTNSDEETARAWRLAGADAEIRPIGGVLTSPAVLDSFQILTIPGGFSYGDDLGAGVVFGFQLVERLGDALNRFRDRGGLILGICNGFQVLTRAGLLPGPDIAATLARNVNGRYTTRWVTMKPIAGPGPWFDALGPGQTLEIPSAHAEGRFLTRTPAELDRLFATGRVALSYVDKSGEPTESAPANPNGSPRGVAGVRDATGRVFGLMPHPERYVDALHHPRWTRRFPAGTPDGLLIFQGATASLL